MSSYILVILFFIYLVAAFIFYHKIFIVFYTNLGMGLLKELISLSIVAAILAGLTLYVWYIVAVILAIIGFLVANKAEDPNLKRGTYVIFAILIIIIAIAGISFNVNRKKKNEEKEAVKKTETQVKSNEYMADTNDYYVEEETDTDSEPYETTQYNEENDIYAYNQDTTINTTPNPTVTPDISQNIQEDDIVYANEEEHTYLIVSAPDGYVNFREGPNTDYNVIMPIANGNQLELIDGDITRDRWVKVAYWIDGGWDEGWVASSQVKSAKIENQYLIPESSSNYIDEGVLYGFTAWNCKLARNEIYARHGRMFKDQDIQTFFNSKPWYTPLYTPDTFDEATLNGYEKANLKTIKAYEQKMGY